MIRSARKYSFIAPKPYPTKTIADFSLGMNTQLPEDLVTVRNGKNVRFGLSSGWSSRMGSQLKGNVIGTSNKIDGLHSYVTTGLTSYLLASYNGDIYNYVQSGVATTAFTSTTASALGLSKDRSVFLTTILDTNGRPYVVIIYQSGVGIKLRSASYPYTSWSTATSIDASTQVFFSACIDSSDNIYLTYNSDSVTIKYVLLTFSATPSWSVGSVSTVATLGAHPSITRESSGRVHIAYNYTNVTSFVVSRYSDNGSTWSTENTIFTMNSTNYVALTNASGIITAVIQSSAGTTGLYYQSSWTGSSSWSTAFALTSVNTTTFTGGAFTLFPRGTSVNVYSDNTSSSLGLSSTSFGTDPNSNGRKFTVINVGVNQNNIQSQEIINNAVSPSFVAVTTGTSNEFSPSSPESVSGNSAYIPVVWVDGTSTPFNIKVNGGTQWKALTASITAGNKVESVTMPFTAAGGTGAHYFVNNKDVPKKWDGTTFTTATASGIPVTAWIFAQDNRLHMGGGTGTENTWYYTNLGTDNFSGTFPTSNVVYLPEAIIHGMWYRDSVSLFFSRNAIYVAENFDYTGATITPIRKVPNSYGTLSARTVKQVGSYVYYQRPDGQIMRTNGLLSELVSDPIFPTLAGIDLTNLTNANALSWGNYYFLSVTSAGSAQNDTMVVLDTRVPANRGGFSLDTGKYSSVMVASPDGNGVIQPYFGDARSTTGNVYQMELGNDDNGVPFTTSVETGIIITGDVFSSDLLRDLMVISQATPNTTMTVGWTGWKNTNSYTNMSYSIDTLASTWGTGTWGDGRTWGGNSNTEMIVSKINILDRGFKFIFQTIPSNGQVYFDLFALTFQRINDRI